MELSEVGEQVYADQRIIQKRIRKVTKAINNNPLYKLD